MKLYQTSLLAFCGLLLFSCNLMTKKTESTSELETNAIVIEKLMDSPQYENAELALVQPDGTQALSNSEVNFDFNVLNYELGAITESVNTQVLANSAKGQHIHFILNNQPYSAHYESTFSKNIPEGVHHLVAFLSRSYHESVKNENSVIATKIQVGDDDTDSIGFDMNAPTLIYSRPKGTYKGQDTESILLDFFLFNTELSEEGNYVKASINETSFDLFEWVPYVVKNLPMGENTITLTLVNSEGELIEGPFNSVTRTIILSEGE